MNASASVLRRVFAGLLFLAAAAGRGQSYVFTTLAGTPSQGFADGTGAAARFAEPQALAVGPDGAVYVADYNNGVVRRVTRDGVVSTVAGAPRQFGYVDGAAADARFMAIFGIAVDPAGNIYVSEAAAATVRKITPGGVVSTLAGAKDMPGSADGIGVAARFSDPRGLAVDAAGNVYVGDIGNTTVRKIAPDGTVTTLAGTAGVSGAADGTGAAAQFGSPYAVAVDGSGNVFVADWLNSTIRKITASGVVTTVAGSAGALGATDGTGAAARFDSPNGIAVDPAGNLYVSDGATDTIRMISPAGVVTTIAGGDGGTDGINDGYIAGYADGLTAEARFNGPTGVAVDPAGYLYIADTMNCTIRRIDTFGLVTTIAGQSGAGTADGMRAAARFFTPQGLILDAGGNLYVADTYNHTIRKITPDGAVTTVTGSGGVQGSVDGAAADARFRYPQSLAMDGTGNLYITDYANDTIRKLTPGGVVSTLAGLVRTAGSADGYGTGARFNSPAGLALGPDGDLVVADSGNHTIRRITPDGAVTTIAGQAGVAGAADGPALLARFNSPWGIAFDAAGNLYVADSGNNVIRRITPDGTVSTIAGRAGIVGSADGVGGDATFNSPSSVAADASGDVFVADSGNHTLRKVSPSGAVTTLGGSLYPGFADGMSDAAELDFPTALALDPYGNLYFADQANQVIRKAGAVGVAAPASRLYNLSVRANLAANQPLITGFVLTGPAKPILVRAIGPGLAPFGLSQVASNPRLEIHDASGAVVQANDDWVQTPALLDAFNRVGAFGLPPNSPDAVVLSPLDGLHTVHVTTPGAGTALIEAYDTGDGTTARLVNVSARYNVGTGADALFAGFAIVGSSPKTVLIRGVGPGLAAFPIGNLLADPRLKVFLRRDGADHEIATDDDWAASLTSTFDQVGAFRLPASSKDAAILISLAPGEYTAQLTGAGGGTGNGMIEVYEVGN